MILELQFAVIEARPDAVLTGKTVRKYLEPDKVECLWSDWSAHSFQLKKSNHLSITARAKNWTMTEELYKYKGPKKEKELRATGV